jgi:hypothetical protein
MIISFALILSVSGCGDKDQNISNNQNTETEIQGGYEGISEKDEILDVSLKIYEEFSKKGKLEDLETVRSIVIYAYEYVIAHASLRQYWRIEPLPEACQELTEKYISGLSYEYILTLRFTSYLFYNTL